VTRTDLRSATWSDDARDRRRALAEGPLRRLERMLEIRQAEETIRSLHESGEAWGSTHLADGQEAVAVGIAAALDPDELYVIGHRAHGHALAAGLTLDAVLGENCSRQIGAVGGIGGSFHLTDLDVGLVHCFTLMGSQIPIAAGLALARQVRGEPKAALAVFGDGSANIGAFHEGLNLAAVWQLPVVFACENNHWSEFTRFDSNQRIADLAERAGAYGMPGEVVDGQDVDAVIAATGRALERARSGGGPTLLELKTYRYSGHNRTDPMAYRDGDDFDVWARRDPIEIAAQRLVDAGDATERTIADLREDIAAAIEASLVRVRQSPPPDEAAMFAHVDPTAALAPTCVPRQEKP
jgi:TPP-dependent pyruvate/acetoin dehydrogenase alpha subunit